MANILITTSPPTGHVAPFRQVVTELVRRGHRVRWYSASKHQEKVEKSGATYIPYRDAHDYDDTNINATFPEREKLTGFKTALFDIQHIFADQIVPMHQDILAIYENEPFDVILSDIGVGGVLTASRVLDVPYADLNASILTMSSNDKAPIGMNLQPTSSFFGRLRNTLLNTVFEASAGHRIRQYCAEQYRRLGFTEDLTHEWQVPHYLMLQPTVPSFEYVTTDFPRQIHFIGALAPPALGAFEPPVWWDEVTNTKKAVIVVTQGTFVTDSVGLFSPVIEAFSNENVIVVAAGLTDKLRNMLLTIPDNVRAASFVPFANLLPYADLYITNGGYGGVQQALHASVPIIIAGNSEEKGEIATRATWSGVGIGLTTERPSAQQIRDAWHKIQHDPSYLKRLQEVSAEMQQYDAPCRASDLLEKLIETRTPVLREDGELEPNV